MDRLYDVLFPAELFALARNHGTTTMPKLISITVITTQVPACAHIVHDHFAGLLKNVRKRIFPDVFHVASTLSADRMPNPRAEIFYRTAFTFSRSA
jgi:hypothetical protein